jgi:hypothetical protein
MTDDDYFDELDDSNDIWYLPANDTEESVIVKIADRYYLWHNDNEIFELVLTKIILPIDNA